MASQTGQDSYNFVLDMVSDVCRVEGFNVEKNVPGTLPVSRNIASKILAYGIENGSVLKLTSMPKLEFRPYYFADFTLNHGKKRKAKGVIVFDGVDGRECDAGLFEGELKNLPGSGLFIDCLEVESSTVSMPHLPPELAMKNTVTVAPAGVAEDFIRAHTGEIIGRESGAHPDAISVSDITPLHMPILTAELVALGHSYRKILQAATSKIIWDETRKCNLCDKATQAVCEECGGIVCHEHTQLCSPCRKHLCTKSVTTKTVINKSPLSHR